MTQAPSRYVPDLSAFEDEEQSINGLETTVSTQQQEIADQTRQRLADETAQGIEDDRPVIAETPGQALSEFGKITTNAGLALVTDYADLAAGLTDVLLETGKLVTGQGFDGDNIFNDRDNPWTQARIEGLKADTQLGDATSRIVRVGVALATLPKMALAGIFKPLKFLSVGGKVKPLAKAGNFVQRLDKAKDVRTATTGINKGFARLNKAGVQSRAAKLGQADDWLKLTYKDIVNANQMVDTGMVANWMRSTGRAASGLTKGKSTVRTVGEALGWGAFVSFNEAGERDVLEDTGLTDLFKDLGLPYYPGLEARIDETSWETKMRLMAEGLMLDAVISPALDIYRIAKFSRAFSQASGPERNAIIRAFNTEAEELGAGFARLQDVTEKLQKSTAFTSTARTSTTNRPPGNANVVSGMYSEEDAKMLTIFDKYLNDVEGVRNNNLLRERQQAAAARLNLDDAQRARLKQQSGDIQQGQAQAAIDAKADTALARPISEVPPTTAKALPPDEYIEPVDVRVIRPPEPTVSPQTMREAFNDFVRKRFGDTPEGQSFAEELLGKTYQLLPRNEVDLIDYIQTSKLQFNELGVQPAADSAVSDFIVKRGLEKGYITLNDDFMLMFNRKLAFDYDRGQYVAKKAQAVDEAAEIERYNAQLAKRSDPATGEAQDALDPAKPNSVDPRNLVEQGPQQRPSDAALIDASRKEALAATQEAGATAAERQELIDAAAKYGEKGSPGQVVAEMLNVDIDNLPPLSIEKIGARRYQIVDEAGEAIDNKTFGTKKLADKGLEIAQKNRIKDLVAKANAAVERGQDQAIDMAFGANPVDSAAVRAQVTMTQKQVDLLNKLGVPIDSRSLDLSQVELSEMGESLRQLATDAKGTEKRMLNNILRKVDEAVIDLGPAARRDAMSDSVVADSQKFLKDGEICY